MRATHKLPHALLLLSAVASPAMGDVVQDFADAKAMIAKERDHALEMLKRVVSAPDVQKEMLAQALVMIGDTYRALGAPRHAMASYERVLNEIPGQKESVLNAHLGMGETYRVTQDWQKALESFRKAVPLAASDQTKLASAYQRIAETHEDLKQIPEAAGAYETLLKAQDLSATTRSAALNRLAGLYIRAGLTEKAVATYERVVSENSEATVATAILALKEIAKARRRQGKHEDAVSAYRRIIVLEPVPNPTYIAYLNRPSLAVTQIAQYLNYQNAMMAQKEIAVTYLEAGKYDEAARSAVAFMNVTRMAPPAFALGVETVGWALKARHGNLALANQFIQYQNLGPAGKDGKRGTEDDLKSPLPAPIQTKTAEEIPQILAEAISRIPARDPEQHRERGLLALYGGAPLAALKEFRAAYRKCEVGQAKVKAAVDDIAVAVAALEGHSAQAQPIFDYQQYGPAGPDGKTGTADDLKDPLLKYLAK